MSEPSTQLVASPLTRNAIFTVVNVDPGDDTPAKVRSLCKDLPALVRSVGQRGPGGQLSCVISFGSKVWERLFGLPRPLDLHEFREIGPEERHAPSTPGDVLFHFKAERMDLCFELETQIMERLKGAVTTVDEVHGFRYFDNRDFIGFVDGTENPQGQAAEVATTVGNEDPAFAGGSYVIIQKYLHDMTGWNSLKDEEQEKIIGRTKLSDVELDDTVKPTWAHNALTKVVEGGKEIQILRDNMPFGEAGKGEFGTYFIGYSRTPKTTEKMIENMFVGNPPGNYDRLLDFSKAVTGGLFFAPSATFLQNL